MFSLDSKGKLLLLCGVVLLLFIISVTASYIHTPGISEFRFHRTRYEQIVAKAKASGVESGSHLWTSSDMNPASLSRKPINTENMEGMVEVYRYDETGAYMIIITTQDQGHLGTFGYYFSDTPNHFPNDGSMWQPTSQIDAHWWIAENRSW